MAQIDPSIVLQSKGVQLDNPMEAQYRAMQLRSLGLQQQANEAQMQDAMEKRQQQRTLADLYRGSMDPTGKVDRTKLLSGMASAGLGSQIPGVQKQFTDEDEGKSKVALQQSQIDEKKLGMLKDRLTYANGAINALLSRPQLTHDDVISSITGLVQQGMIDQQMGADMVRQLPGNPAILRDFLRQKGLETMDAAKRMELLTPKFEKVDNGGVINLGTVNPLTGQFTPGQAVKKVATPDAVLSSQTTRRGQNMTDSRERSLAAQGVTYQQDADGNLVALPTKGVPGRAVQGVPVAGPDGKPLAGKSNVTEDQAKAAGWLSQAENAWSNMQSAMKKDPGAAFKGFPDFVAAIPSAGAGGAIGNMMRGEERQKFIQASESLAESLLRAATGAGQNKDEAAQKVRELVPQFGDSDAVTSQKMAAIPQYLRSLRTRAGSAAKSVPKPTAGAEGSWDGASGVSGIDPSAIEKELARRNQR